jgi:glucose-6-phosphate 1-dehydrogenase
MATIHRQPGGQRPADVLIVFGISGDLAKVMTFRSLYRLERRGPLTCPVVGVAVDDWSTDDLRQHARKAIEATGEPQDETVFDRFAGRLSYLSGDFGDPATFQRVGEAIAADQTRSSTWRSRHPCSGLWSRAWPRRA